jgi:diguanylate cyclase (GGDEF)-like protein
MVVDAARRMWAADRLPQIGPGFRSAGCPDTTTARFALFLPLVVAGAILLCAVTGFTATRISKGRVEAEQRAALLQTLAESHGQFGENDGPSEVQVRDIARRSHLADLRFDAGPVGQSGRSMQSLHDPRGRIVGWFSWSGDGGLGAAMDRLWGLLALIGAIAGFCMFVAMRAARYVLRPLNRSDALQASRDLAIQDRAAQDRAAQDRAAQDRAAQDRAAQDRAAQDPLTGLPNQRATLEELGAALTRRRDGVVAFALVHLDGFRDVNDTLGRAGGDALLANIAAHLKADLPAGAILGRFEEDEFAIIVESDDSVVEDLLIESLRASLMRPIFIDRMWQFTASIGIARAPDHGASSDEIERRAALALRAARRGGRGGACRFEPQIEIDCAERRFLLQELESAIASQAFEVAYQAIVAADGGAVIGVEALLRWTHPTRGPIAPSVFIPLAEQSGLMSRLGEIVLRRALSDGARWPELSIAVNLSPLQIRDPRLVDSVAGIMKEAAIEPSRVVLELTEGVLIDNPQEAKACLEALRALGVKLALDDFGTGYSSLNYLQKFPFDRLKIDRSFVASLGKAGNSGAIVQSIVTLGHALGMKVLAEGVEHEEQRVLLRLAGCDEMQGYLFATPKPAAEIDQALARTARRAIA